MKVTLLNQVNGTGGNTCSDIANRLETTNNLSQPKMKKPLRRCVYCGISQTKLTRRLKLKHKHLKEVKNAMNATKRESFRLFDGIKKLSYKKIRMKLRKITLFINKNEKVNNHAPLSCVENAKDSTIKNSFTDINKDV